MKQNTIKVSTRGLANNKVRSPRLTVSRIDFHIPLPTDRNLGGLACLCLVATMALIPGRYARADADDGSARILSFQNDSVASTVPGNGDVNPYGVAFVPRVFPQGDCSNQATSWCPTSMTWLMSKGPAPRSSTWRQTTKSSCFSKGRPPWA